MSPSADTAAATAPAAAVAPDMINHPPHYVSGGIEVIDVIEAYRLGYHLGNAAKYLLRAGRKTADPATDLGKACWYLRRAAGRTERAHGHPCAGRPTAVSIASAFRLPIGLAQAVAHVLTPYPSRDDCLAAIAAIDRHMAGVTA